jgi:hypothetical protein
MRRRITEHCYPDKMSIQELFNEIEMGKDPFIRNMQNLGQTEDRYIEEWMNLFCDWMEVFDVDDAV